MSASETTLHPCHMYKKLTIMVKVHLQHRALANTKQHAIKGTIGTTVNQLKQETQRSNLYKKLETHQHNHRTTIS